MTRLGRKIPVEPLDDERYARIEQRVMSAFGTEAGAHSRTRSFTELVRHQMGWLVPAVAVAGVVLAIYLNVRSSVSQHQARADKVTRVMTSGSGTSTYELGDATLVVAANTTLDVHRADSGAIDIELVRGQVDCEVAPRPERARFAVHAGDVDVTVVGTAFQVRRADSEDNSEESDDDSDDDTVFVLVRHGKVRVDSKEGTRFLGAGQSWSGPALVAALSASRSNSGQAPGPGADRDEPGANSRANDDDSKSAAGHDKDTDKNGKNATDDDKGADNDDSGRMDAIATHGKERDISLDVDAPGRETLRTRTARKPQAGQDSQGTARTTRSSANRPRHPYQRALEKARPARARPPEGDSELAAIMELEKKNPERAVERYRQMTLKHGSEAEFAVYSMAYVQYLKLRQKSAALRSLSHYQRRFPRGAHTESVLWLRIRILCEGDDRKACRAAAHTYLGRYPKGRHAKLASQIVNWDM